MATATTILVNSYGPEDHPTLTPLYAGEGGEDGLEITVWVSARAVQDDYGVPGSPTWTSFEDLELDEIEISGVCWTGKQFDAKFDKAIVGYIDDLIDGTEFEWGQE